MATQPGAGAHPKKVRERQRRKAKYPEPLSYTPDSFWTEFAQEVSCCRIKAIYVEKYSDVVMLSVGIQKEGELRWFTAPASELSYWWHIKRVYRIHSHTSGHTSMELTA